MTRYAQLLSMPDEDRRLLARAVATNIQARTALQFLAITRLKAWATRPGPGNIEVDRIVWAGRAAARRMPFATCLSSALALQRLLARNGHDSELHIGVAGSGGDFTAHAWLERDGRILIGEEEQHRYTRLMNWSATTTDEAEPVVRAERT